MRSQGINSDALVLQQRAVTSGKPNDSVLGSRIDGQTGYAVEARGAGDEAEFPTVSPAVCRGEGLAPELLDGERPVM